MDHHLSMSYQINRKICSVFVTRSNMLMLVVLTVLFSIRIWYYLVKQKWDQLIPNLGSDLPSRILMGIHFIGGLCMMLMYPIQKFVTLSKPNSVCMLNYHKINGVIGVAAGLITGFFGCVYILYHRTIGGFVMDIAFGIYGIIVMCVSAGLGMVSYLMHRDRDDYFAAKSYKPFHQYLTSAYGLMAYASMFYRMQYAFVEILFDYVTPNNCQYMYECYDRPLDRFFQFSFYLIPIVLHVFYMLALMYKMNQTLLAVSIISFLSLVFMVSLVFIK